MKYVCSICGYVYDEAQNPPWDTLPDDWTCPLCGAPMTEFYSEGEEMPKAAVTELPEELQAELRPLSDIELSALCSNLARGCEKQYQPEEAEAFRRLSDWFKNRAEKAEAPDFEALLEKINFDLEENYPIANAVSEQYGDRGALRSLVWGEKVTRILKSLLTRLSKEGEAMTENTGVYVCTICGFIYVGDDLPEICPVCKVPNWKFEKIVG